MPHEIPLITTIAAALGVGLILGFIAVRLKLPALVGYLVAGILIGPATPGCVADVALSQQLAEIGVMLLMFGVGLHFSLNDLLSVRRIAVPGAIVQIVVATALGALVARFWGWSAGEGVMFGLCLSVASTVVLLRALESRGVLDSLNGRIAVGWLVVEDTFRARKMMEIARAFKPDIESVVRAHSDDEAKLLMQEGAGKVFMGEHELALGMTGYVLERLTAHGEEARRQPGLG